jgi:hypothetical protein
MKIILRLSVIVLTASLLAGCNTPSDLSSPQLMVTTMAEAQTGFWAKGHPIMSAREQPVARVANCEGRNVSVEIVDTATGRVVHTANGTVAAKQMVSETVSVPRQNIDDATVEYTQRTYAHQQKMNAILELGHLRPGSYEARLVVDGTLAGTAPFSIIAQ